MPTVKGEKQELKELFAINYSRYLSTHKKFEDILQNIQYSFN